MSVDKYLLRGVSSQKEDVHKAIQHLDKGLFPKAFCKVIPDILGQNESYCNIMHADGAGTKSSLAYMYWKKTGDISVWKGIAQDALAMNLNDLACMGVTQNILVSSTIGRNKHKIPGEVISAIIEGTEECLELLNSYGLNLILTGGETADVGDLVRTIMVDSTVTARVKRDKIVDNSNIKEGMVIVGLASYGKCEWENSYNGGMGSNGLTSARHDMFHHSLAQEFPESFDTTLPTDIVYQGQHGLTDELETGFGKIQAGKLVLSPTRFFSPLIHILYEKYADKIKGMVHCSGGGQTKILHFMGDYTVVKNQLLPVPDLYKYIQSSSGLDDYNMYKTFNMGTLMEIYTDGNTAADIITMSLSMGIQASIMGCTRSGGRKLFIHTAEDKELIYS